MKYFFIAAAGTMLSLVSLQIIFVANETFLHRRSWYDVSVVLLDDPYHDVLLHTFTQVR